MPLPSANRLLFRPWTINDFPFIHSLSTDKEVMRYFPTIYSVEQSQQFLDKMMNQYATKGYCYFAVEEKESAQLIGFIGLAFQEYKAPFNPAVDIGWRILPKYWGKGYATEGALACLDFGFKTIGLEKIVAVCPAKNTPSEKVMQRIGMQKVGLFTHPSLDIKSDLQPCLLYEKNSI